VSAAFFRVFFGGRTERIVRRFGFPQRMPFEEYCEKLKEAPPETLLSRQMNIL
jgi:hypothetical protein